MIKLKELRKEKGITQEAFAEELNVSGRTVSRWETGSSLPDISLIVEIADFYGVDVREIIEGERKSEMNEEVKDVARQQAEQIIKEAEGNARKSVDDLGQQIIMKKKELEDIKKQFDVYKAKMESLLISQLELLKDIKED